MKNRILSFILVFSLIFVLPTYVHASRDSDSYKTSKDFVLNDYDDKGTIYLYPSDINRNDDLQITVDVRHCDEDDDYLIEIWDLTNGKRVIESTDSTGSDFFRFPNILEYNHKYRIKIINKSASRIEGTLTVLAS